MRISAPADKAEGNVGALSIPPAIHKGLLEDQPQDALVLLDDSGAASLRDLRLSSHTDARAAEEAALEARATALSLIKIEALAGLKRMKVELVRDYSHLPMIVVRVGSIGGLDALARSKGVKAIYEQRLYSSYLSQSLALVGQPFVAASGRTGSGTSVAVLDDGVEYGRADFGSCISPGVPASCRVVAALDFASPPAIDHRHGTNVAATVLGVAPGTKIVSLNVFTASGARTFDLIAAINWCIANRPAFNIVAMNLSLGGDPTHSEPCNGSPLTVPVSNARDSGIVTVAAAGNDARLSQISDPACVPKVISVGAVYDGNIGPFSGSCTDTATRADQVTCFSNSASILTMLAPGAWISAGGNTFAGTSQAAPHVAGAVAVLRSAFPADSIPQVLERVVGNSTQVVDGGNGLPKPRLNLQAAVGQRSWGCSFQPMIIPATVSATLRSSSCHALSASSVYYADAYRFTGTAGQTVTIDLKSSQFDTYLLLESPTGTLMNNDDVTPLSRDSRISLTLTESGNWDIYVESASPYVTGAYSLSVVPGGASPMSCTANGTTLCLNGGRFRVTLDWTTPQGQSGVGRAITQGSDTGLFWFFSSNNIEAIVKVVNGCSFNSHYWFFAGGLTNVRTTITATDTRTGLTRTFSNPQGSAFQPIQDTAAFSSCP